MSDEVEISSENSSETGAGQSAAPDITFECPMCGKTMVVSAEGAGEVIMCPACDQEVIVPGGPLWDEVKAQLETESQGAVEEQPPTVEEEARAIEQVESLNELRERLRTLENQIRENKTQSAATAENITQALNQATRFKLALQRLEEKQRVLESMIEETRERIIALERLA